MTVDDENSIYVGGLPYDCSDSLLRRSFELYGSIVAVKIINDRGTGGKCYGFITFTNPRSAVEAIKEMDGKSIGGRVVRVNEVMSRGAAARSNYGHENFRRDRDTDWGKGGGRVRENDYGRDRQRDHSRERDDGRKRKYDHYRNHDNTRDDSQGRDRDDSQGRDRDDSQGRDRDRSKGVEEWERSHSRNHDPEFDRGHHLDNLEHRQLDRVDHEREGDMNRYQSSTRKNSYSSYERQSREPSSESRDHYHRVEHQLGMLIKRREELQQEKYDMEQKLEEKKQLNVDLRKRSMKLEDSLTSAKKLSSTRELQLSKLYKGFQQVKDYGEKLKSSEQELQDLVHSVSMEIDRGGDLGARNLYLPNGEV